MGKKVTIDPITRLEGHGKIEIFLDDDGNVENAYLQIPELKGFEQFCIDRPVEELPRITPRICGVCPMAHHMASTKAVDAVYHVQPTETAKKLRQLVYDCYIYEDHLLHFFFLGGPDFVVTPSAPKKERNILGVIAKVGLEIGTRVIKNRRQIRNIVTHLFGRIIHPVGGLPGGVSKRLTEEKRQEFLNIAVEARDFAKESIDIFNKIVLENKTYVDLIVGDIYKHKTYYMGLVDDKNRVNFYEGKVRVVEPDGKEFAKFGPNEYLDNVAEHVEPWSYMKFPFLKKIGWKGFKDGKSSGIYRVAPLARLNVSDGMATPMAQEEFERMYRTLGGKPAHNTLAFHWARLIEALYAAEEIVELLEDKSITSDDIRNIPVDTPDEGVGIVEAARGTLIHHYKTDENGLVKGVNLIVATVGNSAAMSLSIAKAAKALIKNGKVDDGLLNMVEMAFRAYDPCMACATHSLPGSTPLIININQNDSVIKTIRRD
ncbi:MAG TPA: Ni/Fe hydrogenase subunit alpha [Candidatus Cloacimonetes bacterium]|nr:Ni/Fe hydrogenase subunit alpha [Candidatus Cloacimonadota bacterium]